MILIAVIAVGIAGYFATDMLIGARIRLRRQKRYWRIYTKCMSKFDRGLPV